MADWCSTKSRSSGKKPHLENRRRHRVTSVASLSPADWLRRTTAWLYLRPQISQSPNWIRDIELSGLKWQLWNTFYFSGGISPAHRETENAAGVWKRSEEGILLCGSIVVQVAQIKQSHPCRAPQKVLTGRQSQAARKDTRGIWPFEDSGLRLEHIRNQERRACEHVGKRRTDRWGGGENK